MYEFFGFHSRKIMIFLELMQEEGSRFKVQGSRFKVQGSRFKVQGSRLMES